MCWYKSGQEVGFARQARGYRNNDEDSEGAASGHGDCCPPVVDPKTLLTLLGFLAAATYFLNIDITMNIKGPTILQLIWNRILTPILFPQDLLIPVSWTVIVYFDQLSTAVRPLNLFKIYNRQLDFLFGRKLFGFLLYSHNLKSKNLKAFVFQFFCTFYVIAFSYLENSL